MTKEDERKLGSMIEAGRMAVPEANRAKFDAEARDVFENVRAAMDKGDEKRAKGLLERWKGRTLIPDTGRALLARSAFSSKEKRGI